VKHSWQFSHLIAYFFSAPQLILFLVNLCSQDRI
jgi:hypothetical protein